MAHVTVTIAGRAYRMACGDGDEPRVERLAAMYDAKIEEMRGAFGEIGDMRLHVMAALTIADELFEARERLEPTESELKSLKEGGEAREAAVAEALTRAAERIERLAKTLNPSTPLPNGRGSDAKHPG